MKYGQCRKYGKSTLLKRVLSFFIGTKRRGYIKVMIPLPEERNQEEL